MKTALTILFFTTLLGCKIKTVDYNPFDKVDLDKECAIYFLLSEGDWGEFEKQNKDFVIKDKHAIKTIKENWNLTKTNKRMSCGYGYLVLITQNGKLIERINLNEPCGYAITTGGWYDFNDSYYDYIDLTRIQNLGQVEAHEVQKELTK